MPIRHKVVLNRINEKMMGKPIPFSIGFYTKNGERIELTNATRCGLPAHLRNNKEFIGLRAGLKKDKHDYAVRHRLITMFNQEIVVY